MPQPDDETAGLLIIMRAVRGLFHGEDGKPHTDAKLFLDNIEQFCHGRESTACFDEVNRLDPLSSAQLEGRRQVWLRIERAVYTTDEELAQWVEGGDT